MEEVYEDDTKITDELVTRYHKLALRKGTRKAFLDRANRDFMFDEQKSFQKIKSIKTSTLLIWGAKDEWIPLHVGQRMDSVLPNSKLVVLPNSGHVPMEENPEETLVILNEFLN